MYFIFGGVPSNPYWLYPRNRCSWIILSFHPFACSCSFFNRCWTAAPPPAPAADRSEDEDAARAALETSLSSAVNCDADEHGSWHCISSIENQNVKWTDTARVHVLMRRWLKTLENATVDLFHPGVMLWLVSP